jgi:hypothetical protein
LSLEDLLRKVDVHHQDNYQKGDFQAKSPNEKGA